MECFHVDTSFRHLFTNIFALLTRLFSSEVGLSAAVSTPGITRKILETLSVEARIRNRNWGYNERLCEVCDPLCVLARSRPELSVFSDALPMLRKALKVAHPVEEDDIWKVIRLLESNWKRPQPQQKQKQHQRQQLQQQQRQQQQQRSQQQRQQQYHHYHYHYHQQQHHYPQQHHHYHTCYHTGSQRRAPKLSEVQGWK
eukprot:TRINITY_DN5978_c2_g1_i1.p1 TRINITY_DN5978_c2_g1~~TRINITY_DN5978_c2_g1_i1.p1  ORF type:complete len:199 (+),score=39.64 TRINITY_DN5978_c2_g1_i1:388-984(+)